jgi:hypothetical protein
LISAIAEKKASEACVKLNVEIIKILVKHLLNKNLNYVSLFGALFYLMYFKLFVMVKGL